MSSDSDSSSSDILGHKINVNVMFVNVGWHDRNRYVRFKVYDSDPIYMLINYIKENIIFGSTVNLYRCTTIPNPPGYEFRVHAISEEQLLPSKTFEFYNIKDNDCLYAITKSSENSGLILIDRVLGRDFSASNNAQIRNHIRDTYESREDRQNRLNELLRQRRNRNLPIRKVPKLRQTTLDEYFPYT